MAAAEDEGCCGSAATEDEGSVAAEPHPETKGIFLPIPSTVKSIGLCDCAANCFI